MSLRDKILAAEDIEIELIEVPQWASTIEVRSMNGSARARMLRESMSDGELDFEKMYPSILIACCFDPDTGEKVFTGDDYDVLNSKSAGAIEKLAQAGMRLSGLSQQAVDDAKKGSSKSLASDITTGLPND